MFIKIKVAMAFYPTRLSSDLRTERAYSPTTKSSHIHSKHLIGLLNWNIRQLEMISLSYSGFTVCRCWEVPRWHCCDGGLLPLSLTCRLSIILQCSVVSVVLGAEEEVFFPTSVCKVLILYPLSASLTTCLLWVFEHRDGQTLCCSLDVCSCINIA